MVSEQVIEQIIRTSEVARSYWNPALLNNLGLGVNIAPAGATRGFSLPVVPGEVYSIRRKLPLTARFRYVFTATPPAGSVAHFGGSGNNATYDASETRENIVVPAGAAYMFIYLSNSLEEVPGLLIVKASTVGAYWDASGPATPPVLAGWDAEPGASNPILYTGYVQRTSLAFYETVTLTTPNDEIIFHAEPNATGFVYDNDTLQRWYNPAPIVADVDKRPNAHGAYGLGQTFTAEHKPLISGQYYGLNSADAKRARARLVATFSEGHPVTIAVTDEEGVTTRREAWLVDYDAPFAADFSHFTFDLEYIAPDPRRYGETESSSIGLPTPGSGLVWNLGTAPSGLYFDWGTAGSLGQISVTNSGGAATNPRIEVGGAGAFLVGFRITEIETGRELILERPTDLGDVVVLDSRTQRATLNGGDISRFLVSRDWFEIPAGATRRYQINPLGATSGAPTMTIYTASASL